MTSPNNTAMKRAAAEILLDDSVSRQRRHQLDFAIKQPDLGLGCPCMPQRLVLPLMIHYNRSSVILLLVTDDRKDFLWWTDQKILFLEKRFSHFLFL